MTRDWFRRVEITTLCEVCDEEARVTVEAVDDRLLVARIDMDCRHGNAHIDRAEAIDEAARVLTERLESAADHAAAGHL